MARMLEISIHSCCGHISPGGDMQSAFRAGTESCARGCCGKKCLIRASPMIDRADGRC